MVKDANDRNLYIDESTDETKIIPMNVILLKNEIDLEWVYKYKFI